MPQNGAALWIRWKKRLYGKYQAQLRDSCGPHASIQTLTWVAVFFRNASGTLFAEANVLPIPKPEDGVNLGWNLYHCLVQGSDRSQAVLGLGSAGRLKLSHKATSA